MSFVNMGGYQDIEEYQRVFRENSSRWDYLISQNEYSTEIFRRAFAFDKKILEIGYPRNDVLINNNNSIFIKDIKDRLGIPLDKKVILYAPTWRDNQYHMDGKYKFSMGLNIQEVLDELGEEYILLLKPHYLVTDKIDIIGYEKQIFIFDVQQDIQELYLITDILITDYSSVMFDYSLLKRPIIFFTYDLKQYKEEIREFYFDIFADPPGKIVLNNEQLVQAIKSVNIDYLNYKNNYQKFSETYNSKDDGKASKKVVELIETLSQN